jgi:hypothetical protein
MEAMAQTSGWLIIGSPSSPACRSSRRSRGEAADLDPGGRCARRRPAGSRLVAKAEIRVAGKLVCAPRSPSGWSSSSPVPRQHEGRGDDRAPRETPAPADALLETWITGVGIVSCLGEGREMHWTCLNALPQPDTELFTRLIRSIGWPRSNSTSRFEEGRPAPEGPGSGSAPMPRPRARGRRRQATPTCSRAWT